jgi:hypothetical protein
VHLVNVLSRIKQERGRDQQPKHWIGLFEPNGQTNRRALDTARLKDFGAPTFAPAVQISRSAYSVAKTERGRVETAQIHNLLSTLYLHLKTSDFKDLARLVDVLNLHGFLPSFDAR